jgi:AraC-like DNA-binding protein/quercetin dioxygenase-like cupin family protein
MHVSSPGQGLSALGQVESSAATGPAIVGVDAALRYARLIEQVERPIVAMAAAYPQGGEGVRHAHRRAQFLYGVAGVISVTTPAGSWIVPPQHALLVPAELVHCTRYCGAVQLRTLYLEPDLLQALPDRCRLIAVSPLLRELVLAAMALPAAYALEGRPWLVMGLIAAEIQSLPEVPLHAPMPSDRRLVRICDAILGNPGGQESIDHWVRVGGLSRRTLARLFRSETGMSFTEWRLQVRLLEALARIADGQAIGTVALDLGYETASAFTVMFRRKIGVSPTQYLRRASTAGGAAAG